MHDVPGEHEAELEEAPEVAEEILSYYEQGKEDGRLSNTPEGKLEFARTKDLLLRFLPKPPAVVYDVGGGPGMYATWLAALGYEVHLLDPVPLHLQQAMEASEKQPDHPISEFLLQDAREIMLGGETADAVLLMGPLYHLPNPNDRRWALSESLRVLKSRGVLLAVGISRFASVLDGLKRKLVDDPEYVEIMTNDLATGEHLNTSTTGQDYFTTSYLHPPTEFRRELANAGFQNTELYAIEGPAWMLSELGHYMDGKEKTEALLALIKSIESETSLIGASAHILAVGRKA